MARPEVTTIRGFDPTARLFSIMNSFRDSVETDIAAGLLRLPIKRFRQLGGSSDAHLSFVTAGKQRRDMMSEARRTEIDLAQAVEEQETRSDNRMFELGLDKLQRREACSLRAASVPPTVRSNNRVRSSTGSGGDLLSGPRIESTIGRKSSRHLRSVAASFLLNLAKDSNVRSKSVHHSRASPSRSSESHVKRRLNVSGAEPLQIQILVPGHLIDRPVIERMRVVPKTWPAWIFDGGQPAARYRTPLQTNRPQTRAAQVRLQDKRIVSGAQEDAIVLLNARASGPLFAGGNRNLDLAVPTSFAIPTVVRAGRGSLK